MKGPLFLAYEQYGFGDLGTDRINDLEKEYSILLEERSVFELAIIPVFDEVLALSVLCWFNWPGKMPVYRQQLELFLNKFEGIRYDSNLQRRFRNSITQRFKSANTFMDIRLAELSEIFVEQQSL